MSVVIESVLSDSYAYRVGIQANDELVSINSHEIFDVLDYLKWNSSSAMVKYPNEKRKAERTKEISMVIN